MAASNLIDGRAIAEQLHAETARVLKCSKSKAFSQDSYLCVVGEDPASKVYVGMKGKTSARLGIWSRHKSSRGRHE